MAMCCTKVAISHKTFLTTSKSQFSTQNIKTKIPTHFADALRSPAPQLQSI